MTQVAFRVRIIAFLCLTSVAWVENNSAKQYHGRDVKDFFSQHHPLFPGGLNYGDIYQGLVFVADGLPAVSYTKDTEKYFSSSDEDVAHDCEYCRRRHRAKMREKMRLQKKHSASQKMLTLKKSFLQWPIDDDKYWISCYYGRRRRGKAKGRMHKGIDLAALNGTPVKSAADGVVELALPAGTFGNMILIRHNNGYKTRYAHLKRMLVRQGSRVKQGQVIGRVGRTGRVRGIKHNTGDHLHFEVLRGNTPMNPTYFLV